MSVSSPLIVKLAWRNLWRNKLRTGITLGAIVLGLLGVILLIGFLSGMYISMIQNAISWQTSHIKIKNSEYLDNPDIKNIIENPDLLTTTLANMPEVAAWSSRFLADGMIASARTSRGVQINGIDINQEAQVSPLADSIIEGKWLDSQGRNPVLVSIKTAKRLKLRTGSKVVLTFTNAKSDVTGAAFRVRGIFKTPSSNFDDTNVYVRRNDLKALAGIDGVHEIAVRMVNEDYQDRNTVLAVRDQLRAISSPNTSVRDWQEVAPMLAAIIGQMDLTNVVILVIYVIAMAFGIINVMLMSVFERTREFGVLMAVGMQKRRIFLMILLETTLLGIVGGITGVTVSAALLQILQYTGIPLGAMAEGLEAFGVDTLLYPRVSISHYQMVFITVVAASILAALYPARQILKQRPVDAMAAKN